MSFDLLAPHYRRMEFVLAGEKLQRCRTAFLDKIPAPKNVLLLGEGHGRCLVECYRRFPDAQIVCVDASEGMLMQTRRQIEKRGFDALKVKLIHADALDWNPIGGPFDLIITHFFLDCFREDQLKILIPRLAAAATPDANWLVADFQNALSGWKCLRTRLILWSMYVFFRIVARLPAKKLTPPDGFLKRAGFALHQRIESEWNLLHSDWWKRSR
ncbi:MAG TPA: class I SAM-dependent methyltransferase [Verrucomicrobiae bacterium]|nr:class I SAM-dependent methyltransferase [Verrucomicrobiae bacterium]